MWWGVELGCLSRRPLSLRHSKTAAQKERNTSKTLDKTENFENSSTKTPPEISTKFYHPGSNSKRNQTSQKNQSMRLFWLFFLSYLEAEKSLTKDLTKFFGVHGRNLDLNSTSNGNKGKNSQNILKMKHLG